VLASNGDVAIGVLAVKSSTPSRVATRTPCMCLAGAHRPLNKRILATLAILHDGALNGPGAIVAPFSGSPGTIRKGTKRQRHAMLVANRAPRTEGGYCPWVPWGLILCNI